MSFQDEPRNTQNAALPDFDITAAEVQQLLADNTGHGLSNYLSEHAASFIYSGGNLKTPFRVLWYAENLGLTSQIYSAGQKDSKAISLRDILSQINQSNSLNGKREVSMSTVLNALTPMAKTLLEAFKVKVLIDRRTETIKLLSEAFAASMFSNMRADAERVFRRYNDVIEQANAVGVETSGLIAGSEVERTARLLTAV